VLALSPDILVSLCARFLGPASIGRLCVACRSLSAALARDEELWASVLLSLGGPRRAPCPRDASRELQTLESVRWSGDWGQDSSRNCRAPAAREHYAAVSCAQGKCSPQMSSTSAP
jgi:hypothetical protein